MTRLVRRAALPEGQGFPDERHEVHIDPDEVIVLRDVRRDGIFKGRIQMLIGGLDFGLHQQRTAHQAMTPSTMQCRRSLFGLLQQLCADIDRPRWFCRPERIVGRSSRNHPEARIYSQGGML